MDDHPQPIPCAHCGAVPVRTECGLTWTIVMGDNCFWTLMGHPVLFLGVDGRELIEAWNRRNGPQTC